ncbi:helix-turn-helix transcriptional regulator [Amycolatopsis sp. NPDC021455]|uniref:helix-turn-helix transcriptional regulator n=1 Tax=Amycolatopsis sp. NPDC021455 TaxID=3154901 RepID=UPI0033D61604
MPQDNFGRKLRSVRLQRGLTQADLAGEGLSTSYISLLESGKRPPTSEAVLKLAARLDVAPELLVDTRNDGPGGWFAGADARDAEIELELRYAEADLLAGDTTAALRGFAAVWESSAASAGARLDALAGTAAARERAGYLEDAADAYAQWLELRDESPEGCYGRWLAVTAGFCRCARELGRVAEAVEVAEKVLAEAGPPGLAGTPAGLELASLLAQMRDDLGDAASGPLPPVPADRAGWQAGYLSASRQAKELGRIELALSLAERAVLSATVEAELRDLARVRACEAVTLARREPAELTRAVENAEAAVAGLAAEAHPPHIAHAEIALATLVAEAGDEDRAFALAKAALGRLGPPWRLSRARAELLLGRCHRGREELAEADACYERAGRGFAEAGLPRLSAQVHLELAGARERVGDVAEALAAYRRAAAAMGLTVGEDIS